MARWAVIERNLRSEHGPLLAGVDEVGRGPLAGPVVACAVVMPPELRAISGVDDSKQLDRATRERLAVRIRQTALAVGIGAASAREVDQINIYHATVLAMRRALLRVNRALGTHPHHVVIDGLQLRTLGITHTAVVKGDARCYAIACASIVAKVTRDRLMHSLHTRYDGYGWLTNSGYGTLEHRAGIVARGLTPHHRMSFCLRQQLDLALDAQEAELGTESDDRNAREADSGVPFDAPDAPQSHSSVDINAFGGEEADPLAEFTAFDECANPTV